MKFFDQKEEVIDVQLTQYGKYLLSLGKFKPEYYSFFDDDIIYDVRYASASAPEVQNDIEPRIQENTPRLKVQYVHHGLETNIQKVNEQVRTKKAKLGDQKILPTAEKSYALSGPIGTSSPSTNYLPAWNLAFLKGEISGSVDYTSGSYHTLQIPQIDADVNYEISIGEPSSNPDYNNEIEFANKTIFITPDFILLNVQEENSPFGKENFDIEVFLVEEEKGEDTSSGTQEVLIPLSFKKKASTTGLLDQESIIRDSLATDASFVDYFLEVFVDDEITSDEILTLTKQVKPKKSIYETPQQAIAEDDC